MRYRKEIITTVGTLACAVGIGFVMQQSQTAPALSADGTAAYPGATLANADAAVLNIEEIILTAAEFSTETVAPQPEQAVAVAATPAFEAPTNAAEDMPDGNGTLSREDTAEAEDTLTSDEPMELACDIVAESRAVAAAMVKLSLSAPCLPEERVTVHHAGMLFNQITDAKGEFDVTVPAMALEAMFVVAFTNGEGAVTQTTVEELADYDRVALQWKGETGFELHAREFGADYGTDGHVWSGAARDMTYAITGQGGFITRMGDPGVPDGLMAEVYTFPSSNSQNVGDVDLSVEAEVANNNCGLEIEAQTLQTRSGNDITSRDLTLSVPDCDAAGNFLVLNNLFEDLKVASN